MPPMIETEGEFAGWHTWKNEAFEYSFAGPFYFTQDDDGIKCAFRAEKHHLNGGGVVHGGCLMTFADFSLFAIAHKELEGAFGVTVSFASEFLSSAKVGSLVEARGEVLRAGGSLIFIRGIVTSDGQACLNYSATIKKIRPRE